MHPFRAWWLLILMILWMSKAASAEQPIYRSAPHIRVALVSEASAVARGRDVWVGVHQQIDKHWHTYWVNPGDSGLRPRLKWDLQRGVVASKIFWPVPKKIRVKHLANYGYESEVLLLAKVTIPSTFQPRQLRLKATFSWLVCKEECIPGKALLSLNLPVKERFEPDSAWGPKFAKSRDHLPKKLAGVRVKSEVQGRNGLVFSIAGFPKRVGELEMFPLTHSVVHNAAKQVAIWQKNVWKLRVQKSAYFGAGTQRFTGLLVAGKEAVLVSTTIPKSSASPRASVKVKGVPSRVVLVSKDQSLSLGTILAGWRPWSGQSQGALSFWAALLFAVVGGLILNLMPCVFPVLSIKVLHFVEQAGQESSSVRKHGLAFWTGVQVSFSLLAALLIGLRSSGSLIGWGFQLQLPHTIFLLAVVLFGMGLSLSGLFEMGAMLQNLGSKLGSREGYVGSFFSGVLATLVATPCTAPFMGASIAYALTQPAWIGLLVFNSLAFGMSLPYLVFSFFPNTLNILPKPGPWMKRVQELMAFPLYGATLWLLWVLGQQTGSEGMMTALVALLLLSLGAWLLGVCQNARKFRRLGLFAAYGWIALTVLVGVRRLQADAQLFALKEGQKLSRLEDSQAYRKDRLAQLLKDGKNVFLNLTAAWCISCKVNEKVALQSGLVRRSFRSKHVQYLKGDWTNRSAAITEILEFFGRNGVPLYVLFHGKSKRYMLLPQVLTPGIVQGALLRFGTGSK